MADIHTTVLHEEMAVLPSISTDSLFTKKFTLSFAVIGRDLSVYFGRLFIA